MKALINYFCLPVKPNAKYEAENIYMIVEIPYVPAVGTMLKLTNAGEFVEVVDVYLDISHDQYQLNIGLKEPVEDFEWMTWEVMSKQGWKIG